MMMCMRARSCFTLLFICIQSQISTFFLLDASSAAFFAVSPPRRASSNHDGMQSLSFYDFTVLLGSFAGNSGLLLDISLEF